MLILSSRNKNFGNSAKKKKKMEKKVPIQLFTENFLLLNFFSKSQMFCEGVFEKTRFTS